MSSIYLTRAVAAIYVAPIAIWGVCSAESLLRCALSALHTLVSFNSQSRSDNWNQTKGHGAVLWGTGLATAGSLFPIFGTYKSYNAIFKMAINHVQNTWKMRDLQQRANAHTADTLYQELLAPEPDVEKLIIYGTEQAVPTREQINATAHELKASLVSLSWTYSFIFHSVDGSYRALRIVAIRIRRVISVIFAGHLLRAMGRGVIVIFNAAKEEIKYPSTLVHQPNRVNAHEGPVVDFHQDSFQVILKFIHAEKEQTRQALSHVPVYRQYVISNALTRYETDGPLPEGAPNDYLHMLRELPKAFGGYAKVKTILEALDYDTFAQRLHGYKPKDLDDATCHYILDYFKTLLPCLNRFKFECTVEKTGEAKKNLLFALSTKLTNLREISLDLKGVDPRWQMLIGLQLAKHSPLLHTVTLVNADPRVTTVMRRFVGWLCTVR